MTALIISSSVLIIVVIALRLVFRGRMSARLQYALWALIALRLIIPAPLFASPISIMNPASRLAPVEAAEAVKGYEKIAYSPNTQTISAYISGDSDRSFPTVVAQNATEAQYAKYTAALTAREIFTRVRTIGIIVSALFFLAINIVFTLRLKKRRRELTGTSAENEYPCLRKSKLPVFVADGIPTPFLYGLFRPAIYINTESLDSAQLDYVLSHEQTHFRHGDNLWAVLRILCLCLHWYNPLVWLAAILSKRDCELACDEAVIARLSDDQRISYGKALLSLTCKRGSPQDLFCAATTMTGGKRTIKERITRIAKKPRMLTGVLVAVILICVMAVGCTFSGAAGGTELNTTTPETPPLTETDAPSIPDKASVTTDEYIEFLKTVNWKDYFATTADYEVFTRMTQAFTDPEQSLTAEQIGIILSATNGLDGAMSEAYCSFICAIYNNQPTEFAEAYRLCDDKQKIKDYLLYADPQLDTTALGG